MTATEKIRGFHTLWRLLPVLLAGSVLSITCAVLVRTAMLERRQAQFENMAISHAALVRGECLDKVKEIGSLQRFFEGSVFVEISEFRQFIAPWLTDGETTSAVEWIPRIKAEDRPAFEREFLGDTLYGLGITENGVRGTSVRAPDRDEYFPILYAEPFENNRMSIGFDLGSKSHLFNALKTSGDTGTSIVVFKTLVPGDDENEYGFRVICPVYRDDPPPTEPRRLNLAGFVAGAYRFNDIVETALYGIPSMGIDLTLSDVSASGERKLLWRHASDPESKTGLSTGDSTTGNATLNYRETFEMSGRTWEIVCGAAPESIGSNILLPSWVILVVGLILTGLLTIHLNVLQERNRKVNRLVQERTEEIELLSAAVEQVGESVIITDRSGIVQYVNAAFEKVSGYSRKEIAGQFAHRLSHKNGEEGLFPVIVDTLESGKSWQGMVASIKKNGEVYYENATLSPVVDKDGNVVNHVCVRHDLTDELRLQDERNRLEAQYHQAQKMESVGRLAGGVAHDLNNLLGPILGYSEMLMEEADPNEKEHKFLESIHQAGMRARQVVRQLLAFSRKQSLSLDIVDINAVVEGFRNLIQRTLRENIHIEFKLSRKPLTIKADAGLLEQVLMNLVVNAQDAMTEGGRLLIETSQTRVDASNEIEKDKVTPGRYALLTVSDTGQGMDEETLNHVFEPFFTTKEVGKGTGLGLAMVYGTVKQHGGHIQVHSESGKGTSFKLYFPMEAAREEKHKEEVRTASAGGGETLMVVEDDGNVRKMVERVLSRKGYRVLSAGNGNECLDILEGVTISVDMMITDVIMPDMNGKELHARVVQKYPGMKVLFMSGYTDDVITPHGILAEDLHFIQKPFSAIDIVSKVRKVLDGEVE